MLSQTTSYLSTPTLHFQQLQPPQQQTQLLLPQSLLFQQLTQPLLRTQTHHQRNTPDSSLTVKKKNQQMNQAMKMILIQSSLMSHQLFLTPKQISIQTNDF